MTQSPSREPGAEKVNRSTPAPASQTTPSYPALLILLTVVYYLAGKLGLTLAIVHSSATAVWAPTGIAIASMLILGYRVWPAIFVGAFLVNVTTAGSVA